MNKQQHEKLRIGEYIKHKRYGVSRVEAKNNVGTVIQPVTYNGQLLLYYDSHDHDLFKDYPFGTSFLEDDLKQLKLYTPSWKISTPGS